jgi:hypothetical protein
MAKLPQKGNTQFCCELEEVLTRLLINITGSVDGEYNDPLHPSVIAGVNIYKIILSKLKHAVNFRVPKEGDIITDMIGHKDMGGAICEYLTSYKLPFPIITIECENDVTADKEGFIETNVEYKGTIIIVWEEEGSHELNPKLNFIVCNKARGHKNEPYRWMVLPYLITLDFDKAYPKCTWDELVEIGLYDPSTPVGDLYNDLNCEVSIVIQFLIALSCKNVSIKKGFPPSIVENNKRIKKGKPQLNQYYEILIQNNLGEKTSLEDKYRSGNGGSNTLKTTHIRRGHIRRYENKNVWIEQTVVNAHKGKPVKKTYKIK